MRPSASRNSHKTFLPSTPSLSAASKEEGACHRRERQNRLKAQGKNDSSSSQTSEDGRYSQAYTINQGVFEPSSKAALEAVARLDESSHIGKDANEHEDEKLPKAAISGERKFMRTVVCLGMLLRVSYTVKKDYTKNSGKCFIGADQQGRGIKGLCYPERSFTHPRLAVNVATSKELEGPKCTTAGIVGL
ncbi:hypothetical protein G9A89_016616 [Geosiphon pyriformis]|nr:hypothetical protein G9A89_016616 [Geosiphon pyriformis]